MRLSLVGRSLLAAADPTAPAATRRHDRTKAPCAGPAGLGTTRTTAPSAHPGLAPSAGPRRPLRARDGRTAGMRPVVTRHRARP